MKTTQITKSKFLTAAEINGREITARTEWFDGSRANWLCSVSDADGYEICSISGLTRLGTLRMALKKAREA